MEAVHLELGVTHRAALDGLVSGPGGAMVDTTQYMVAVLNRRVADGKKFALHRALIRST